MRPYTKPIASTYQKLSVTSTAETLGAKGVTLDAECKELKLSFEGEAGQVVARYRCDGTAPTATDGHPVVGMDVATVTRAQFSSTTFIAVDADVDVHVEQFDFEPSSM